MSGPDEMDFEELLRKHLAARGDSVSPKPDPVDLARRIERAEASTGRGRLAGAAAAVVLAAGIGGVVGSILVPSHPQRAYDTADTGNQGGPLPAGPKKDGALARPLHEATTKVAAVIDRVTRAGTKLDALSAWLTPVSVSSGTTVAGCYKAELVATSAVGNGDVAGATGVVALQPLAADGLELVDSGVSPSKGGRAVWWVTVAVGTKVARVAAEQPDGTIDAMKPVDGLAVLGGVVPAGSAGGYFSVVAETPSGQSIHSLGFLAGWGPKAWGAAGAPRLARGCGHLGLSSDATTLSSQPAAPFLATSAVVASFHQALTPGLAAGPSENLAAVRSGASLSSARLARLQATSREMAHGARLQQRAAERAAALAKAVQVEQVAFLSAAKAEVVYRTAASSWLTGTAVLSPTGLWQVSKGTFCAGIGVGSGLASLCRAP